MILRVRLRTPQILNKHKVMLCLSCPAAVPTVQANPKHMRFRESWEYSSACEGSSQEPPVPHAVPHHSSTYPEYYFTHSLQLSMLCKFVKFNSKSVMTSILSPSAHLPTSSVVLECLPWTCFLLACSSLQIQSATTPLKSFWLLLKYS